MLYQVCFCSIDVVNASFLEVLDVFLANPVLSVLSRERPTGTNASMHSNNSELLDTLIKLPSSADAIYALHFSMRLVLNFSLLNCPSLIIIGMIWESRLGYA